LRFLTPEILLLGELGNDIPVRKVHLSHVKMLHQSEDDPPTIHQREPKAIRHKPIGQIRIGTKPHITKAHKTNASVNQTQ
jgi:hypothetical protein